jgi:TrpR family trp operon transcriptional repressor
MSDQLELLGALCRVRDRGTMDRLLREVLTSAERRDLALRWELMRRLVAGESQRKIAQELGISLCKITRGSRVIRTRGSVCRRLLGRAGAAGPVGPARGKGRGT